MRLPWQVRRERLAQLEERAAAAEREAQTAKEALVEVNRVIANSPMLGMPVPGLKPPPGTPLYQFDYPIRYSTPQPPQRKPDSLVTLDTLRQLADTNDILRSGIQHLKREVAAVPLEIVARDKEADPNKAKKRIAQAKIFFEPHGGLGGKGRRRSQFEAMWIEDVMVCGAACFYYRGTRGGGLYEVLPIDAATIRPRTDAFGWPGPSENHYEQWIYGVQVAAFTRDQMTYDGLWPVSYTPYFKSAVEWILAPALSEVKADEWNRMWLTHGNTPADMLAAPDTWTPEQIQTFYEWFNSLLTGNTAERVKTKIVPGGTTRVLNSTRKDQEFQQYELWLMRRTLSVLGVQPASIGFVGEQYKVSQGDSFDQTSAFGVGQLLEFRKARYDEILQRMGFDDLETQNVTAQEEAAAERAERLAKLVAGAIFTPNEARNVEGKEPIEGGDELFVSTTLQPLSGVQQQQEQGQEAHEAQMEMTNTQKDALAQAGDEKTEEGAKEPESRLLSLPEPAAEHTKIKKAALPSDNPQHNERAEALRLWERKALNRLKEGRRASCPFESPDLTEQQQQQISERLAGAESTAEVRSIFRDAVSGTQSRTPNAVAPLYIVRHARTEMNGDGRQSPDRIRGWLDVPLSRDGEREARAIGEVLVECGIARIVTSDLLRTRQTAEAIRSETGAPIEEVTESLRPWNLGDFQGQLTEEVFPEIAHLMRDAPDEPAPNGETFNDFRGRLLRFLKGLLADAEAGVIGTTAVVTHYRDFKFIREWMVAGAFDVASQPPQYEIDDAPPGSVMVLSYGAAGWQSQMLVEPEHGTTLAPPDFEGEDGEERAETTDANAMFKASLLAKWRKRKAEYQAQFGDALDDEEI